MRYALILALLLNVIPMSAAEPTSDNVVSPVVNAYEVVIPAAGKIEGANGTFFRSEVTIANLTNRQLIIFARWLPGPGKAPGDRRLTIAAGGIERYDDFVRDVFRETGLGAAILTAITVDGQTDTSARMHVSSRIYSPQPGTLGTTSQSFPALSLNLIDTPTTSTIFGLGSGDDGTRFRFNVGIVNLDANRSQDFMIQIPRAGGVPETHSVTLPPMTMQQVSLGRAPVIPYVRVLNVSENRSNKWVTYGSTLDEVTGDAWSELGLPGSF